eukprot:2839517-Pyramimonas_sp.AAC.1
MDQCAFGLSVSPGTVSKKPTRLLSNSHDLLRICSRKCTGDHEHLHLVGGARTKASQQYPRDLVAALCQG